MDALSQAGPALSILAFVQFALFTPVGLLATYLTVTGFVRTACAWFDARGAIRCCRRSTPV